MSMMAIAMIVAMVSVNGLEQSRVSSVVARNVLYARQQEAAANYVLSIAKSTIKTNKIINSDWQHIIFADGLNIPTKVRYQIRHIKNVYLSNGEKRKIYKITIIVNIYNETFTSEIIVTKLECS